MDDLTPTGVGTGAGLMAAVVALIVAIRVAVVAWFRRDETKAKAQAEADAKKVQAEAEVQRGVLQLAADWPNQMMARIAELESREGSLARRLDDVEREAGEIQTKYQVLLAKYNDLQEENVEQSRLIAVLRAELVDERRRAERLAAELHELHRVIGGQRLREIADSLKRMSPPRGMPAVRTDPRAEEEDG